MNKFKVQIVKTSKKIVEVEADSFSEAISIVRNRCKNRERSFVLFLEADNTVSIVESNREKQKVLFDSFDSEKVIFGSNDFEIEYKKLVDELIEYCYEGEERHFEEFENDEKPDDHIYLKIKRLKKLNKQL